MLRLICPSFWSPVPLQRKGAAGASESFSGAQGTGRISWRTCRKQWLLLRPPEGAPQLRGRSRRRRWASQRHSGVAPEAALLFLLSLLPPSPGVSTPAQRQVLLLGSPGLSSRGECRSTCRRLSHPSSGGAGGGGAEPQRIVMGHVCSCTHHLKKKYAENSFGASFLFSRDSFFRHVAPAQRALPPWFLPPPRCC